LVDAVLNLTSSATALAHITVFSLVRLLRLVRVATVLRRLRDLYEFGLLMACIANSARPICWSFTLLGFMFYVSAIVLLQLLEQHLHSGTKVDSDIFRLYGGFGQCIYTLLLAISGGTPWSELVQPLTRLSGSFYFIFAVYVCIINFFGLNILIAVFVSYVSRIVENHHEQFLREGQLQAVSTADELREKLHKEKNDDGRISLRRLEQIFRQEDDILKKLELSKETALGIFEMLDTGIGGVDVDEFVLSLMQVKGKPAGIHIVTMMYENKRLIHRIHTVSDSVQMLTDALSNPFSPHAAA